MQAKKVFNTMTPYTPGKQIEEVKEAYGLSRIVKLASNENPFGYSEKVQNAIPTMLEHLEIYPDGYATKIREELSNRLKVEGNQLIFGCGSDEVVDIICRTYLDEASDTVMAIPTFPQYKHNALIQGASIKEVPLINGYHDIKGMLEAITNKTKIVWLCSPNNPTGALIPKQELLLFLNECPKDVLIVLDEAYYEYISNENNPQSLSLLKDYPNLIVLRTFSKAYGLANLRIGYGVASLEIANTLNIARGPFNTTSIAQEAATIALKDEDFLANTLAENSNNKKAFYGFLKNVGLTAYDSEANFVFVKLPTTGDQLCEYLLERGYIIRSGEALGHPNGVRITIGSKEQMEELSQLIKDFLVEVKEENQ